MSGSTQASGRWARRPIGARSGRARCPLLPLLRSRCSRTHCRPLPGPCRQGLVHMAKTEGIRGMMKGNGTNCARIVPNSAMKFFTYEQLSR
jgi:hypothetical protein